MASPRLFDIKVALGEALANAIRHGAPPDGDGEIVVRITAYPERIVLEVLDNGLGFDGAHAGSEDLYAPGGRGIMFMRALMDRVEYDTSPSGGTLGQAHEAPRDLAMRAGFPLRTAQAPAAVSAC